MSWTELSYGEHSLQVTAVFERPGLVTSSEKLWFVYIHGGAWVAPTTYHDCERLFEALDSSVVEQLGGLASIDYRRSPEIQHPEHMEDVAEGLRKLVSTYGFNKAILAGHSAGGCLAIQTLISIAHTSIPVEIPLTILIETIVNIPLLLVENASYRDFVEKAFGKDEEQWSQISPIGTHFIWSPVPVPTADTKALVVYPGHICVVQSPDDELLIPRYQSELAVSRLQQARISVSLDTTVKGLHDEVISLPGPLAAVIKRLVGEVLK